MNRALPWLLVTLLVSLGVLAAKFLVEPDSGGPEPLVHESLAPVQPQPDPPRADLEPTPTRRVVRGDGGSEIPTGAPGGGVARIRLRTLGPRRSPLAALIFVVRPGQPAESVGGTGEAGLREFHLARGPCTLIAQADKHAAVARSLYIDGNPLELTLQLAPAGSIIGSVRRTNGAAAGFGVTVLALDAEEHEPSVLGLAARAAKNDPRLARAQTDAQGRFRLNGLDPHRRYRLEAVDPTSFALDLASYSTGSEALLVLRPLYAKSLTVAASDGVPIDRGVVFQQGVQPAAGVLRQTAAGVITWLGADEHPGLALTALGPALARGTGPEQPLLLVGAAPSGTPPRVGPVHVTADLPGYRRETREIWLEPLRRTVAEETLYLTSDEQRGELEVDVRLSPSVAAALRADARPLGAVTLHREGEPTIWLPLPAFAALPARFPSLPAGRYGVRFTSRDGGFGRTFFEYRDQPPLGEVRIQAGKPARLRVDLEGHAALYLRLGEDATSGWFGPAVINLEAELGQVWFQAFDHPPYTLLGVPEGTWQLSINRLPGHPTGPRGGKVSVSVTSGEVATPTLPL